MDERDVIFTRMRYIEGSDIYTDYYDRVPSRKAHDDYLRSLPQIGEKRNVWYDQMAHTFIDTGFEMIVNMKDVDHPVLSPTRATYDQTKMTEFIKTSLAKMGARAKIVKSEDAFYYDIKGRPDNLYGQKVYKGYKNIIVFSMPMDLDYINEAPMPKEMLSTIFQYMQGTYIAIWMSKYINKLGYQAKANYDGNYDVVLPLVAQKAGLGQIGHNGLLIDEEYGPRVRLGAVLVDLDLDIDDVTDMNVLDVCKLCNMCSTKCLAQAIHPANTPIVEHEKCYERWRIYGTDCAVCLKVCPFSQKSYEQFKGKLTDIDAIKRFLAHTKNDMTNMKTERM